MALNLHLLLDTNVFVFSFQVQKASCSRKTMIHLQQCDIRQIPMQLCASSSDETNASSTDYGELERLKLEEKRLSALLTSVREQKLAVLRERPLNIGIVGFGRFGHFIAKSFTKYGNVVGTSRSDYTVLAEEMGAKYLPMSDMERFVIDEDLDVIILAVSIVSFEDTVKELVPHLKKRIEIKGKDSCPLIVDVLSVKEHPRNILLKHLPEECDILCTHPVRNRNSDVLHTSSYILFNLMTWFFYCRCLGLIQQRMDGMGRLLFMKRLELTRCCFILMRKIIQIVT